MRSASPLQTISTAAGWIGLVGFLLWQEFYVEIGYKWPTVWWFRVPATLAISLVVLVFAIECILSEMTVRRWATSAVVFFTFGLLFFLIGIFNPDTLQLSRWLLLPLGLVYVGFSALAAAGAKDAF